MAAGLGFKTFNTGDVLSAADVNGYLMQGVLVFTDATARDAAITSPQEGQFAFTKNNDSLWYYNGSSWVASGATGDIEGVTAGVGISGGGTSGTVTITNSMATAIDAKGDLVVGTGADTFSKLTVGANGTILTADSAEATGMKWATPAGGGGMTLINTGGTTLTGSSVAITSIPTTYKYLIVFLENPRPDTDNVQLRYRFNNDSGANRYATTDSNGVNATFADDRANMSGDSDNGITTNFVRITIWNYASSTMWKTSEALAVVANGSTPTNPVMTRYHSAYNQTTAVTQLNFFPSGGNWTSGTVYVYGVS